MRLYCPASAYWIAALCILLGACDKVQSNAENINLTGTPWEGAINIPPDTVLNQRRDENGEAYHTLKFSGGVTMEETKSGIFSHDHSGYGAVLCSRELTLWLKATLEECGNKEMPELVELQDYTLKKINQFIVNNSIHPVSLSDLHSYNTEMLESYRKGLKKVAVTKMCKPTTRKKLLSKYTKALHEEGLEKLKEKIDKSLSVHRPPVLNPCL